MQDVLSQSEKNPFLSKLSVPDLNPFSLVYCINSETQSN